VEELMATTGAAAAAPPQSLLLHFPYKSEMNTRRADLALDAFGAEMGSADFFVVADGMSKVPEGMAAELKRRGVKILLNHRLTDTDGTTAIFENGSRIKAEKLILALHAAALQKLPAFRSNPIVKSVRMRPLLRTYAVFDSTSPNPIFTEKKVVTDSPIRYIIPVNKEKGVVMISYTDGDDAEYWLRILKRGGGEPALEKAIMREIRALFAPQTIPDPIFFKSHPWHDACSYWLPGTYDPKKSSEAIMNPAPNIYVCGESFSLRQAWVEGALEHAEQMLTKFLL
jgi:monoamine oxidase